MTAFKKSVMGYDREQVKEKLSEASKIISIMNEEIKALKIEKAQLTKDNQHLASQNQELDDLIAGHEAKLKEATVALEHYEQERDVKWSEMEMREQSLAATNKILEKQVQSERALLERKEEDFAGLLREIADVERQNRSLETRLSKPEPLGQPVPAPSLSPAEIAQKHADELIAAAKTSADERVPVAKTAPIEPSFTPQVAKEVVIPQVSIEVTPVVAPIDRLKDVGQRLRKMGRTE